jgi:hypothetical protein
VVSAAPPRILVILIGTGSLAKQVVGELTSRRKSDPGYILAGVVDDGPAGRVKP